MESRRVGAMTLIVISAFFAGSVAFSPSDTPTWYAQFKTPEGMLVLVGIATLAVVAWQALETKHAAEGTKVAAEATKVSAEAVTAQVDVMKSQVKATQETVDMQRVAMQQWVQVEGWTATRKREDESRLLVTFEVRNLTSYPLTLTHVSTTFAEPTNERMSIYLLPRETHFVTRGVWLTQFQGVPERPRYEVVMDMMLFVIYEDAFTKNRSQSFGKTCIYNHSTERARFEAYRGILPPVHRPIEDDDFQENG